MKRLDAILLKIFLYGLPPVICVAILDSFYDAARVGDLVRMLYNFTGLVFSVWMGLSVYLCLRLLCSRSFRDRVLSRITFIKERDEREALLTGRAVKTTFLTSLAILIFLLCLSCFQVSFYRVPTEKAINGKTGAVSLGFHANLLNNTKERQSGVPAERKDVFSYTGLPVSTTAVILLLIIWQIVSYNYSMRRLSR